MVYVYGGAGKFPATSTSRRNSGWCPRNPWASTVLDSDMERAEADVHPRTLNTGLTVLDQVLSIVISALFEETGHAPARSNLDRDLGCGSSDGRSRPADSYRRLGPPGPTHLEESDLSPQGPVAYLGPASPLTRESRTRDDRPSPPHAQFSGTRWSRRCRHPRRPGRRATRRAVRASPPATSLLIWRLVHRLHLRAPLTYCYRYRALLSDLKGRVRKTAGQARFAA
jgi:hypothetical protein